MADATPEQSQAAQTTESGGKDDAAFYKAEAQKAFKARDELKAKLRELEGKVLSDDDLATYASLKEQQAKAEEERAKKAGEFESLKQTLLKKHQDELEAERTARKQLEQSYTAEKIEAAFLGASDLFGGHDNAKTILTGDIACSYLGKYVSYEDVEVGGKTVKAIVVRNPDGEIILDGKGNPAKFGEAMTELISLLPTRDRILRGSGKTGSGSSGGATGTTQPINLSNLTPEQRRDPKVLAQLRASLPRGGLVMGEAYNS